MIVETTSVSSHQPVASDLDTGAPRGRVQHPDERSSGPQRTVRSVRPEVYQGIWRRSRKNPPVGPPSGSVASQTIVSAPFSTERVALGPPMSVRTHPGSRQFTSTLGAPARATASATMRVSALSAVLESEYEGA